MYDGYFIYQFTLNGAVTSFFPWTWNYLVKDSKTADFMFLVNLASGIMLLSISIAALSRVKTYSAPRPLTDLEQEDDPLHRDYAVTHDRHTSVAIPENEESPEILSPLDPSSPGPQLTNDMAGPAQAPGVEVGQLIILCSRIQIRLKDLEERFSEVKALPPESQVLSNSIGLLEARLNEHDAMLEKINREVVKPVEDYRKQLKLKVPQVKTKANGNNGKKPIASAPSVPLIKNPNSAPKS